MRKMPIMVNIMRIRTIASCQITMTILDNFEKNRKQNEEKSKLPRMTTHSHQRYYY